MKKFKTLNELFLAMKNNELDEKQWTDLPNFGGQVIDDTTEIWSWDEENVIVGTCSSDIKIISRSELMDI